MKIRFKSSIWKEDLVKNFKKDFQTSKFIENTFSNFKKDTTGKLKEIQFDSIYVQHQKFTTKNAENNFLEIHQNSPVYLLKLIIDGKITFYTNNQLSNGLVLQKKMYYLFHLPSTFTYKFSNQHQNVLNIYFTEAFLTNKMGSSFANDLQKCKHPNNNNEHCLLFCKNLLLDRKLKNIVNDFLNCPFNGTIRKTYLESKLTELLLTSLTTSDSKLSTNKLRNKDKETLMKIETYIRSNLKNELSIEKLSALAGFNTFKFKTIFKQVYDEPVFQYITALRIEKAIHLITKHNYTIAQASYEVGYKNPQHFTVAFKKKLGYLPSQLIKELKSK